MKLFTRERLWVKGVIVFLGLTLTGLLAFAAVALVPPRHEATASVLLLPGRQSLPGSANPFLFLGGVTQARDVLVKVANADSTREDLLSDAQGSDYEVTVDPTSSGPLVLVTVEGEVPASVLALRDSVVELMPLLLQGIQDEAQTSTADRITSMLLVSDEEAQRVVKSQIRAVIVAAGAGLGLTFAALAGTEALARRRTALLDIAHRSDAVTVPDPDRDGSGPRNVV